MNLYLFAGLFAGLFSIVLAAEFGTRAAIRPGFDVVWSILCVVEVVLATLLIQKGIRQEKG